MSVEIAIITPTAPPSPFVAFWHAFRENRGAVIGLCVVILVVFGGVFAHFLTPYDPLEQYRDAVKLPPIWVSGGNWSHPLGTDPLGRDMWARIIYGSRLSLFIGLAVMLVSTAFGVVVGLSSAWIGGWVDVVVQRVMDVIISIPDILLSIMVIAVIGPNLTNTVIAIMVVYLPRYVRIVRSSALVELSKDYVTASQVSGVRSLRLMVTGVFPNCMAPLIVQAALGVSDAILAAAGLGFLGLGAQPPTPEWGSMLADAKDLITSDPWVMAMPGLAILITVLAINLMGDGLRDALDPRLRRS
ncbi:MAG: ABC transporter permease subunit [Pseudomonadota bacterium]|nr:ABC transporter permease subunit [Pseudomonadota bacterium]